MAKLTLADLNEGGPIAFAAALGHVFEHAPWVAARAARHRPFASVDALHAAMVVSMREAGREERLALIRGHPELAGKAAVVGDLTADSRREQAGAGLDRLTEQEYRRFHALNDAYKAKFGFPFILAVRGKDKHAILAAFAARIDNDAETEFATAIEQIARITRFRLDDLIEG